MIPKQSFYANKAFINVAYAIDIALFSHLSNLLLDGDQTRMIYSSNAYSMRKRSDDNNGDLNFPFINFKTINYEPGLRIWWNSSAWTKGIFVPEISAKVKIFPITLSYECSFWCHRDDELRYAITELIYDADNKTILKPNIEIESEIINFPALVDYSPSFEPEYDEQSWLEQNNIHTISMDFTIDTFGLKTNSNISIPQSVLFNFIVENDLDKSLNSDDYDEMYELVVDHLTETVYDDTIPES